VGSGCHRKKEKEKGVGCWAARLGRPAGPAGPAVWL
jgi:hypothetical protein